MFEGLVLTILERVLGQCATPPARCASVFFFLPCVPCMTCDHSFPPLNSRCACLLPPADVEGLDRASLKVAVWSGSVTLTDVRLRREACYALGLPVHIKLGCVKLVQVTIPWSKLGSEPVTIKLDGVYFVAGPLAESDWDEEAQKEWAWARKEGRINRLEQAAEMSAMAAMQQAAASALSSPTGSGSASAAASSSSPLGQQTPRGSSGSSSPSKATGGGRGATLIAQILHNLQVEISNLHVRYEDSSTSLESPFAIGLTLQELSAFTTDQGGNRRFCVDPTVQHKWVELKSLAIYHHVGCRDMCTKHLSSLGALCEWLGA